MGFAWTSLTIGKYAAIVAIQALVDYGLTDIFENFLLGSLFVSDIIEVKLLINSLHRKHGVGSFLNASGCSLIYDLLSSS